jgi:hypothetical protein
VGNKVMLNTFHRRKEYINRDRNHMAKFLPMFDGPYTIVEIHPIFSTYKLKMLNSDLFLIFHASELKHFIPNNSNLFPSHEFNRPGPIIMEGREE